MYKIYTRTSCPFCIQAKMLLTRKGLDYEEVKCESNIEHYRKWIREELNMRTFPVIEKDGIIIGGFTELQDYLTKEEC